MWLEVHTGLTKRFQLVLIELILGYPARIGVCCDRTVAPKGGRLRNRIGGNDLKMLFMRFAFLSSSILFGATT
jgi:hypothetical protein